MRYGIHGRDRNTPQTHVSGDSSVPSLSLTQDMLQGLREVRRVAPSGGLERQRHGKPGDLVILCAPFLLECIGWI